MCIGDLRKHYYRPHRDLCFVLFYFVAFLEKIWMKPFKHKSSIIRFACLKSLSGSSEENALEA